MNWSGQPLTSHEVAVNLIAGTTTRTGLTVHAERDTGTYPRGIKISDREMKALIAQYLTPHEWQCRRRPVQERIAKGEIVGRVASGVLHVLAFRR
jgi:hypothetical protein